MMPHTTRRSFLAGLFVVAATVCLPTTATFAKPQIEEAVFGGGCFWSLEHMFKQMRGVESAEPGYAGGRVPNPSYEMVGTETTGHAEAVRIRFDPSVVSYDDLLKVLFSAHNPTTLNRQGNDIGARYRSVVFYRTPEQKLAVESAVRDPALRRYWRAPIVTAVEPYKNFYRAEDYHVDYFQKHPNEGYCRNVVAPKVRKFQSKFKAYLKQ